MCPCLLPQQPSQCRRFFLRPETWLCLCLPLPRCILTPLGPWGEQQARRMELLTDASCSRRLSTSRWAASARWGGGRGASERPEGTRTPTPAPPWVSKGLGPFVVDPEHRLALSPSSGLGTKGEQLHLTFPGEMVLLNTGSEQGICRGGPSLQAGTGLWASSLAF